MNWVSIRAGWYYRVLEPDGLLVVQVPIGGDLTYEDLSITDDEERLHRFLQEDHVRLYGRDLGDRMQRAGFECEILTTADVGRHEQALYSVGHPVIREVFLARRPADT